MAAGRALVVFGISSCDTVRKARAWLVARDIAHSFHDVARAGVPPDRLSAWLAALGWEAVVNRRGTTWRKLDGAARDAVVDTASAAAAVSAHPSLIKRPLVEWPDGTVSVGFDAGAWGGQAANSRLSTNGRMPPCL